MDLTLDAMKPLYARKRPGVKLRTVVSFPHSSSRIMIKLRLARASLSVMVKVKPAAEVMSAA